MKIIRRSGELEAYSYVTFSTADDLEEESEDISDEFGDEEYDSEDEKESKSETGLEMRGIYGRSVQSYNSDFEEGMMRFKIYCGNVISKYYTLF